MIQISCGVGSTLFAAAVGLAPLAQADSGQYVRTQSGLVRCLVLADDEGRGGGPSVACEHGPSFPQAPGPSLDLAIIRASGAFKWDSGNIGGGGAPQGDLVLNYGQTYHLQGWTVLPTTDGTRFTNDRTGHGMFVSVENVSSF